MRSKLPSFRNQAPTSPIAQLVSPLVTFGESDDSIFCSGTATQIAKNLHLTAGHVIRDFVARYGTVGEASAATVNSSLWLTHIYPGPDYAIWEADAVWFSAHSDLALIHTKPYNDIAARVVVRSPILRLLPPEVGERVVGFGYRKPSAEIRRSSDGGRHFLVNTIPTATEGEVVEVHMERRDQSRLVFPCFRLNSRFDGGMSGGPVFDDAGAMCGVICSNLPPETPGGEHISYAASLWPITAIMLTKGKDGKAANPYPAHRLIEDKVLLATDFHLVRVVKVNGSSQTYDPQIILG